jgi:replicative DNA helicase
MGSKYVDTASIVQVIGCVYNNVRLLDFSDRYIITENDFADQFHKVVFGAIYKLYELGASTVTVSTILDFLSSRPKSEAIFKKEKGEEWLLKVSEIAVAESFDYYYSRLKKMSLLRAYDNHGIDVTEIYDPDNLFDAKKKQLQEERLDNSSLEELANKIDLIIDGIRAEYVDNSFGEAY